MEPRLIACSTQEKMWYNNKLHKRRSLQQQGITASGISTTLLNVSELPPSWYGPGKMVERRIEDSKKIRWQQLLRNLSCEIVLRKIKRLKLREMDGILPLKLPMTKH
ncbi:hypothetical protein SADUNF_Sadunf16G0161200 [Salix dunnii]|uniref:Uncharacterized protein n=1 Tax=Salix dunnii TaxID=1413687 RepID=A0A835JBZ5_9ROSI|nr:hypothetical protein SADUNF_Sadunf16G0161200 [Salix dunnii]